MNNFAYREDWADLRLVVFPVDEYEDSWDYQIQNRLESGEYETFYTWSLSYGNPKDCLIAARKKLLHFFNYGHEEYPQN